MVMFWKRSKEGDTGDQFKRGQKTMKIQFILLTFTSVLFEMNFNFALSKVAGYHQS